MKLFVGNLPYSATEADITDFFTQAGVTVDSVNVMRDRFTGEARGFGFVEINDDAAANHAVEACNGRDLMGRALVVNEARPMVPREGRGGGGRRRAVDGAKAAGAPEKPLAGSLKAELRSSRIFSIASGVIRHNYRTDSRSGARSVRPSGSFS